MRVLIACEFSGLVRDAFIARGHDAISCDYQPTERPGPHHQGTVYDVLDWGWDLMVAFPPCRYLTRAGGRWWSDPRWQVEQRFALEFVTDLMAADIPRIAVENPRGLIGTRVRQPDQTIQPWQFGHPYRKETCLWLKGLPKLRSTHIVDDPQEFVLAHWPSNSRANDRSRTFPGVADAMAAQWGEVAVPHPGYHHHRAGERRSRRRKRPEAPGTE